MNNLLNLVKENLKNLGQSLTIDLFLKFSPDECANAFIYILNKNYLYKKSINEGLIDYLSRHSNLHYVNENGSFVLLAAIESLDYNDCNLNSQQLDYLISHSPITQQDKEGNNCFMEVLRLKRLDNSIITEEQLVYFMDNSDYTQSDSKSQNILIFCVAIRQTLEEKYYKQIINKLIVSSYEKPGLLFDGLIDLYYYHPREIPHFISSINDIDKFCILLNKMLEVEQQSPNYKESDCFLSILMQNDHFKALREKWQLGSIVQDIPSNKIKNKI